MNHDITDNDHLNQHDDLDDGRDGVDDREEILLSRIADRSAAPADWDELEAIATGDVAVYQRLAETLRFDAALRDGVDAEVACADGVDLVPATDLVSATGAADAATSGNAAAAAVIAAAPGAPTQGARIDDPALGNGGRHTTRTVWAALACGWAASLLFALLWFDERRVVDALMTFDAATFTSVDAPDSPGDLSTTDTDTEFVGELSKVLVESLPTADGGFEVLYVRRIVERTVIDDFYQFGEDESGEPFPIAMSMGDMTKTEEL